MNRTNSPLLTPQQQQLRADSGSGLQKYKNVVGSELSWLSFIGFEIYQLLFSNLSGLLGYGLRRLFIPCLTQGSAKKAAIGKNVQIRQPQRLTLGSGVIVDDNVVLDVRLKDNQDSGITIGDNVFIGRDSIIAAKNGSITLGDACNISSQCRIATESKVEIGTSVLIAAYTYIGPGNHQTDESGKLLVDKEMVQKGGVSIGDNVWIGTRCTILDGVTIGKNAVIGAHSLVKEDVPEGATVAGVPARVINK